MCLPVCLTACMYVGVCMHARHFVKGSAGPTYQCPNMSLLLRPGSWPNPPHCGLQLGWRSNGAHMNTIVRTQTTRASCNGLYNRPKQTYTHIRTCIHTPTYIQAVRHTGRHIYTYINTHHHIHTYIHTHIHKYIHIRRRTHVIHTHTHTHIHEYIQAYIQAYTG